MDRWKKIGKVLLFPHMAILLVLLPMATVFLVYSMVVLGTGHTVSYVSYVLAFYTLTVWCVRIPGLIMWGRTFRETNPYIVRWNGDVRLRMKVSLYGTFLWNAGYAVFQLCLGLYHKSFWYWSMAVYYFLLAVMRFFLAGHTRKHEPGEQMRMEFIKYRACGWIFLAMNVALTAIIFFMVYWNRTFHHHEITTIAMAAYTFTAFTKAIINMVRYTKFNSPVYTASKIISMACACVSMLTLEATMLTTFGDGAMDIATRKLFLALSGGAVSVFIIVMAVYMIAAAGKALKQEREYERE